MNAIGKVIYNILINDSAIAAATKGRIFPNVVEQGVAKGTYIVYYIQQHDTIRCQGQTSYSGTVCVYVGASTYKQMVAVLDLVNQKLDKYSGTVAGQQVTTIMNLGGEGDDYDADERINGRELHYKVIIN